MDSARLQVARVGILAATAVIALNVWTGAPLLAVYAGSKIQSRTGLSMEGVVAVIVALAIIEAILGKALAMLTVRYDDLTGRDNLDSRSSPWLRSMSGEREEETRRRIGVSDIERILAISVALAVAAMEIWFFFFAGSSIG